MLTFVDLGPRLITVTHHNALAGPYHRNARQIIDVMRAWRGDADNAHAHGAALRRRLSADLPEHVGIDHLPFRGAARLLHPTVRGKVPDWLAPVALPANSPYRMWRVKR